MWNILKEIKLQTSLEMSCGIIGIYNNMVNDMKMVEKVEQKLKINSSDKIYIQKFYCSRVGSPCNDVLVSEHVSWNLQAMVCFLQKSL